MNIIETKSLCKNYKDKKAVKNLNLAIEEGELYALLGVNGAGKSTTIKMLSCVSKPTSGEATIGGFDIVKNAEKVKEIINVSPQETAVAEKLTVFENLMMISEIYGLSKSEAEKRSEKIIDEFNLSEFKNKKAAILSGGYKRRLSIGMALITEPTVLFLDEPTLGLDVLARRELWSVIEGLKGKMTIILTTHYLEEAEALSNRIAIMVDGVLKCVGTAAELKEKAGTDNFEDAFIFLAKEGELK